MFFRTKPEARQTLVELLPVYTEQTSIREATLKRYRCELRRFERLAGAVPVREISPTTIGTFRAAGLKRELSPDSIEGTLRIVFAILRFCRDRGWLDSLPLSGKRLQSNGPNVDIATEAELNALYGVASKCRILGAGSVSPMAAMRAWVALTFWTGLRLADSTWRLSWSHVRWDERAIVFRASKTSRVHAFPIDATVEAHLRSLEGGNEDRLFGLKTAFRLDRELARLCDLAGIRKLSSNTIRLAGITAWNTLGVAPIVHGSGLPRSASHPIGILNAINRVAADFPWPAEIRKGVA